MAISRKKRTRSQRRKDKPWRLIEQVVASAHRLPNCEVQRNVRLPVRHRSGKRPRRREIDVLVSGQIAGYQVHFAIECKHQKRRVNVEQVGSFLDKLADVGLSPNTAIMVSTSSFTEGAMDRGEEAGLRFLILKEGDEDSPIKIGSAIQSAVFMVCYYRRLVFQTREPVQTGETQRLMQFYDRDGNYQGCLPDLIWWHWLHNRPPAKCGMHEISLVVPDNWGFLEDGTPNIAYDFKVKMEVQGIVLQFHGNVAAHMLLDAQSGQFEKGTADVNFNIESPSGMEVATSEEQLGQLLSRRADLTIKVGRHKIPRVVLGNNVLWPLSAQAVERLRASQPLESEDDLKEIVDINLQSFWDPSFGDPGRAYNM